MKVLRWQEASLESSKGFYRGAKVSIGAAGRSLSRVALGIHTICAFAMSCRFIGVRLARLHPFLISEAAFAQMQATLTATEAFLLTILADSPEVPIPDALCLERLFDLPKMTLHALVRCAFLFLLLHAIFARMPTVFTIPLSKLEVLLERLTSRADRENQCRLYPNIDSSNARWVGGRGGSL